jgi:hypothetical protein
MSLLGAALTAGLTAAGLCSGGAGLLQPNTTVAKTAANKPGDVMAVVSFIAGGRTMEFPAAESLIGALIRDNSPFSW